MARASGRSEASEATSRLVFDVTSAVNWAGPPAGIVRCQRELASWALRHRPDVSFALLDPRHGRVVTLSKSLAADFIEGRGGLDTWRAPPHALSGRGRRWLPAPLYAALRIRRSSLRVLERVRLNAANPERARWADRLQRRLMSERHRAAMLTPGGDRRPFVPIDMAYEGETGLGPGDLLICTGSGWSDLSGARLLERKSALGFRLAVLCHDIIPLTHPEWFRREEVVAFEAYWSRVLRSAELVICTSRAVAGDVEGHCRAQGLAPPRLAVSPLGSDAAKKVAPQDREPLPNRLEAGRFALFVSTVEPRKGHEMLYRVWLRLLEAGAPQATGFKLVLAGRRGWMTEALEQALDQDPRLSGSLVRLRDVSDPLLERLYRSAAFCLYPSLCEGYGLPVAEAFARGKALIASDGGALPEVVGDLSPVLPARDEDAWADLLARWIADPAARAPYEAAIAARFSHPTWDDAAERFFAAIDDAFG